MIPIVVLVPTCPPSSVFSDFTNVAGWSSNGLAWFVGLISSNLPFVGFDGPSHLAEETRHASTNVPWAVMFAIIINGFLGFAISIAFSFILGDLQTDLETPTVYDFIYVFYDATKSRRSL